MDTGRRRARACFSAFVAWTVLVVLGALDALDGRIGAALADPAHEHFWLTVTALGDMPAMRVLVLAAVLVGVVRRDLVGAGLAGAIPLLGWFAGSTLKLLVARPRPGWALGDLMSFSYPSNHAFVGWVLWVCVVWVLARGSPRRTQWAMLGVVPAVAVAYSRVALGVHHASDLVGAWLLGLAVLGSLPWLTARLDALWLHLQETTRPAPDAD